MAAAIQSGKNQQLWGRKVGKVRLGSRAQLWRQRHAESEMTRVGPGRRLHSLDSGTAQLLAEDEDIFLTH